jgi:hypothetical protein
MAYKNTCIGYNKFVIMLLFRFIRAYFTAKVPFNLGSFEEVPTKNS